MTGVSAEGVLSFQADDEIQKALELVYPNFKAAKSSDLPDNLEALAKQLREQEGQVERLALRLAQVVAVRNMSISNCVSLSISGLCF